MTHRSASRCVFATHPTCWRPGNVVCPQRSPGTCSPAPRPTPFAVGRKLGSFSCSIPPSFVLSHNMPTINTTSNWLRLARFSTGASRVNGTMRRLDFSTPRRWVRVPCSRAERAWRALALHDPQGNLGRHDFCGTPCSRKREHATQRTPWPTRSHEQDWHQYHRQFHLVAFTDRCPRATDHWSLFSRPAPQAENWVCFPARFRLGSS